MTHRKHPKPFALIALLAAAALCAATGCDKTINEARAPQGAGACTLTKVTVDQ
jgi:hypothetical protein